MSDTPTPLDPTTIRGHAVAHGGEPSIVVRVPGRLNLIGEHVDYHGGTVLPIAIAASLWFCADRRSDGVFEVTSLPLGASHRGTLDRPGDGPAWASIIPRAAAQLRTAGVTIPGVTLTVGGDLPPGAGLSSSAAWIVGVIGTLLETAGETLPVAAIAELVPRLEREAFGVPCGRMDPLAVLHGREGHALAIDTERGSFDSIAVPPSLALAVIDTGTRRRLDDGRYAARRAESEEAARRLGRDSLARASIEECAALPEPWGRRARHVVTEIARVHEAIAALRDADRRSFGAWVDASHESLRDDYEVSSPELEAAVEIARAHPGTLGARLTGAGFAGSVLAVVEAEGVREWVSTVGERLGARLGPAARVIPTPAAAGAEIIRPHPGRLGLR